MELPSDLNGCSAAIPAALEEMMTSHNNIGQISQYCKSAYQQVRAPSSLWACLTLPVRAET